MIMVMARILFVERRLGPFPYLVIGCEGVESRRLSVWPLASEAAHSPARGHLRECVPRKNALKPVADGILSQDGQQGHRKELPSTI